MWRERSVMFCGIGIIALSLFGNYTQYKKGELYGIFEKIYKEKDQINTNCLLDITYQATVKASNENSFNQGKIEGMISVINNMKLNDNEASNVWHSGYYRGLEQASYQEKLSYEKGYQQAAKDNNQNVDSKKLEQHITTVFPQKTEPKTEVKFKIVEEK